MDLETTPEFQEIGNKIQERLVGETEPNTGMFQYRLLLDRPLADELQQFARSRGMTMADIIRYAIRLLLEIVAHLPPDAQLVIREEGEPDKYIIIPL